MTREVRFAKYHGIGNDFVLIADPADEITLDPEIVRRLCDRHFGIGADGVIRIAPGTDGADYFMDYVNSDGSVGEMCGNGIRCMVVYVREIGLTDKSQIEVETHAGRKSLKMLYDGRVRVDMGPPAFAPAEIPVDGDGAEALHTKIDLDGEMIEAACVSMGNPHAVLFVPDLSAIEISALGPRIESHPAFPNKTNVEFAKVVSPTRVEMRVWERGSGETLACGTGACAVAVVAKVLESTEDVVEVVLPGGVLEVEWRGTVESPGSVFMTGPVSKSFEGVVDFAALQSPS